MKWNSRAIMLSICEYIAWLCPPVAYCIYSYVSTLQYVLDKKAVVSFWVSFSCILVGVIFGATLFKRVKAAYARYVAAFVQQKADLEARPDDERLIDLVEKKSKTIETMDFVMAGLPLLLIGGMLYAFQNAITELINIFIITGLSFLAKAGIHIGTVHVKAKGMKDKIRVNEQVKSVEEVK